MGAKSEVNKQIFEEIARVHFPHGGRGDEKRDYPPDTNSVSLWRILTRLFLIAHVGYMLMKINLIIPVNCNLIILIIEVDLYKHFQLVTNLPPIRNAVSTMRRIGKQSWI